MSNNWVITRDSFLTTEAVQKLYSTLENAKDLALHRGRFCYHIRDYFIIKTLLETGLRVNGGRSVELTL